LESFLNEAAMLHPPLVHFAVACPFLALLALAGEVFFKKAWLSHTAAFLWAMGFLSTLASLATGPFLALHLGLLNAWTLWPPQTAAHGALREHALWGLISGALSLLTLPALLAQTCERPWPLNLRLALGALLAASFLLAGHEGGEMVYGSEGPLPAFSAPAASANGFLSSLGDYRQSLVKMNKKEWVSRTHGKRWVNTYVSKEAASAYQKGDPLPEGAIVVKESFENKDGGPSTVLGPLYGMKKGSPAHSPQTGGWQYALTWGNPVPGNPEGISLPVTWLPGDSHLNSCAKCHSHFKETDFMGGIPEGFEANP
jgi:uncharacterized membrane protein